MAVAENVIIIDGQTYNPGGTSKSYDCQWIAVF